MQRLISLFTTIEHEPQLVRPASGPPPGPPPADYDREPEYFRHLIDYLRERKRVDSDALVGADEGGRTLA